MKAVTERGALISECGRYRYHLSRRWTDAPAVVFAMLNPSTADGLDDDATIRRCMAFARAWQLGGIEVVNLFAWRARDPGELLQTADPVGPDNDAHIDRVTWAAAREDRPVVAAWGNRAPAGRVEQVMALQGMRRLSALAVTRHGAPAHPLYLPGDLRPVPYRPEREGGELV